MKFNQIFTAKDSEFHPHPIVFMFLFIPFGVLSGYVTVTLAFLFSRAGVSLEKIAPLLAITLLPNIMKFLWAPLVDTTLSVKKWYIIANIITAAGIILISLFQYKAENIFIMTVIVFFISVVNSFIAMSTESLMAYDTPEELKGRAGGWSQAGNLGGLGLGGGAGLWLAERIPQLWIVGVIIAILCLLCTAGLLFFPEPKSTIREESYLRTIVNLNKDIWKLIKSPMGFLALLLCLMPIGSGAASNLWSSISNDWKASADVVALVVGFLGGILSALGCIAGGWICDRMDRKRAYIIFGLFQAASSTAMAFAPHTQSMFIIWCSLYAFSTGLTYAGFSAFTLEAIGKGAAATKYNVFASISNTPIYLMTYVDEWSHQRWGAFGMLTFEALMGVIGMILFFAVYYTVIRATRQQPAV